MQPIGFEGGGGIAQCRRSLIPTIALLLLFLLLLRRLRERLRSIVCVCLYVCLFVCQDISGNMRNFT